MSLVPQEEEGEVEVSLVHPLPLGGQKRKKDMTLGGFLTSWGELDEKRSPANCLWSQFVPLSLTPCFCLLPEQRPAAYGHFRSSAPSPT